MPSVDWSIVDVAGLRKKRTGTGSISSTYYRALGSALTAWLLIRELSPTALTGEATDFSSCGVNLFDQPRHAAVVPCWGG